MGAFFGMGKSLAAALPAVAAAVPRAVVCVRQLVADT